MLSSVPYMPQWLCLATWHLAMLWSKFHSSSALMKAENELLHLLPFAQRLLVCLPLLDLLLDTHGSVHVCRNNVTLSMQHRVAHAIPTHLATWITILSPFTKVQH